MRKVIVKDFSLFCFKTKDCKTPYYVYTQKQHECSIKCASCLLHETEERRQTHWVQLLTLSLQYIYRIHSAVHIASCKVARFIFSKLAKPSVKKGQQDCKKSQTLR